MMLLARRFFLLLMSFMTFFVNRSVSVCFSCKYCAKFKNDSACGDIDLKFKKKVNSVFRSQIKNPTFGLVSSTWLSTLTVRLLKTDSSLRKGTQRFGKL